MSEARAARLADQIKQVVAETLDRGVKDPRLGFVTITDVRVTGDLQHATLFYTVLGSEDSMADTAAALESAKGMIRSEVGKAIQIRLTPSLEFVPDALPETAASMLSLLEEAAARDAELAELAAKGQYAGDPNPYREPTKSEEDDELE